MTSCKNKIKNDVYLFLHDVLAFPPFFPLGHRVDVVSPRFCYLGPSEPFSDS